MNPLQDVRTGLMAGSARPPTASCFGNNVGRVPAIFDCPAERVAVYADGISASDAALGGFEMGGGVEWSRLYGFPSEFEVWNASGIGVAGAHWIPVRNDPTASTRVSTMPFGRRKIRAIGRGFTRLLRLARHRS